MSKPATEFQRLADHRAHRAHWRNWGPYLSERAWGTVREDYSPDGEAWDYFPHDHARSRAYRWNEDGLAGISDRFQHLCFAIALWNGRDAILKERLFGLTGSEGNHGEDVKEVYYYLDNTPTHSYMKMLYKYPQGAFPYGQLISQNRRRSRDEPEYELTDTGIFDEDRYFDVFIEYAKADQNDILIQITVANRGPDEAPFHLLPTLWFRNTWSWGYPAGPLGHTPYKPTLRQALSSGQGNGTAIEANHPTAGAYHFYTEEPADLLFTENETNHRRLANIPNATPYVKDAFHRYIIGDDLEAINSTREGTKVAAWFSFPGVSRPATPPLTVFDCRPPPTGSLSRNSTAPSASANKKPMIFMPPSSPRASTGKTVKSSARPSPACSGVNNSTITTFINGLRAIPTRQSPNQNANTTVMPAGPTSTISTSYPCPTSGNTPGTRPGTSAFTPYPSPSSTLTSPNGRLT